MTNDEGRTADEVIRRARRRAAIWGALSTVLWCLVGLGAVGIAWGYFTFIHPQIVLMAHEMPNVTERTAENLRTVARLLPTLTMTAVAVWAFLLASAAVSTLLFVNASRNAALAQIRDGLRELSEQLGRLSGPRAS